MRKFSRRKPVSGGIFELFRSIQLEERGDIFGRNDLKAVCFEVASLLDQPCSFNLASEETDLNHNDMFIFRVGTRLSVWHDEDLGRIQFAVCTRKWPRSRARFRTAWIMYEEIQHDAVLVL